MLDVDRNEYRPVNIWKHHGPFELAQPHYRNIVNRNVADSGILMLDSDKFQIIKITAEVSQKSNH